MERNIKGNLATKMVPSVLMRKTQLKKGYARREAIFREKRLSKIKNTI